MIKLNLKTENEEQELIKQYLENNASETLAEKINNGVKIVKDNKTLINKKDLNGFWDFATSEARKLAEQGAKGKAVKDDTVYGWAIHYFEEEAIEGKLFNEDGTEYQKPKPKIECKQIETKPIPKKPENTQASLFDFFSNEPKKEDISTNANSTKTNEEDDEKECEEIEYEYLEEQQSNNINLAEEESQEIIQVNNQTIDKVTGEVLTTEQIEKTFDKNSLFILMNYLPELEMR